jgi:hypothetical protein
MALPDVQIPLRGAQAGVAQQELQNARLHAIDGQRSRRRVPGIASAWKSVASSVGWMRCDIPVSIWRMFANRSAAVGIANRKPSEYNVPGHYNTIGQTDYGITLGKGQAFS